MSTNSAGGCYKDVVKASVFPVADDRLGERVCVAVSGVVEVDDLMQHLREQGISKYDLPEYFLRVEEFPLTPSGKILKRELVLRVRRGDLSPIPVQSKSMARA